MTAHRALEVQGGGYRAIATLNGRTRCSIYLYLDGSDDGATPLSAFDINPADARARERSVAQLDETHRAAVSQLLLEVAQAVDIERTKPRESSESPDDSPFPPLAPWGEPVDGEALVADIRAFVAERVILPPHALTAIVLWVYHTYVAVVADFTAYLHVSSPTRSCGKSTLLELLLYLAMRAKKTDSITKAALYRYIEKYRPTLLLDELDALFRADGGEGIRGVLNSGFQRTGRVIVCVGEDSEPTEFSTFCPKVLGGIGRLPETIESRSIPIRMSRALPAEARALKKIRGDRIDGECLPIRRQLARWAEDNQDALRIAEPFVPEELGARQADVWRPLFAIADQISATMGENARNAAVSLHGEIDDETDRGLLVLQDLKALFDAQRGKEDGEKLSSETIVEALAAMEHRPWPEYANGRAITTRGLAKLLGRFGIKPTTIRVIYGQQKTPKGYRYEDCAPQFEKYFPLPPENPQHPQQPTTEQSVADVALVAEGVPEVETAGYV